MKLKLQTIINPTFVTAYNRLLQLPLPARDAYWLAKSVRVFADEQKAYEKARIATLERSGRKDGDNYVIDDPEDRKKVEAELTDLLTREVELKLEKIKLPPDCFIAPADVLALEDLLDA